MRNTKSDGFSHTVFTGGSLNLEHNTDIGYHLITPIYLNLLYTYYAGLIDL